MDPALVWTPRLGDMPEQTVLGVSASSTAYDPRRPSGNVQPLAAPMLLPAPSNDSRWPTSVSSTQNNRKQGLLDRKKSRHRMSGGVLRYSSSYDPHEDLSHRQARKRLQKNGVHFAEDVVKEFDEADLVEIPELTHTRLVPKRAQVVSLARAASMSSHRGSPPPSDMALVSDLDMACTPSDEVAASHETTHVPPESKADSFDLLGDLVDEIVDDEQDASPAGSSHNFRSEAHFPPGTIPHTRGRSAKELSSDSFDPKTIDTYAGFLSAPSVDFNFVKLVPYLSEEQKIQQKKEAKQLFRFLLAVAWLRQGQGCTLRAATSLQRNTLAATLEDEQIVSGIPGSVFLLSGSGYCKGAKGRRLCAQLKQRLTADMKADQVEQDSDSGEDGFEYFGDAALDIWPHSAICFGPQMVSQLPLQNESGALLSFPADSAIISRSSSRFRNKSLPNTILRSESSLQFRGKLHEVKRSSSRRQREPQGLLVVRLGDIRSIRVDRRVKAGTKPGAAPVVYNYSTLRVRNLARPVVLQWSQMKDAHMFANSVKLLLACLDGGTETFTEVGGTTSRIRNRLTPHTVQEIVDVHFAAAHNRSIVGQRSARTSAKGPLRQLHGRNTQPATPASDSTRSTESLSTDSASSASTASVASADWQRADQAVSPGRADQSHQHEESILSTSSSSGSVEDTVASDSSTGTVSQYTGPWSPPTTQAMKPLELSPKRSPAAHFRSPPAQSLPGPIDSLLALHPDPTAANRGMSAGLQPGSSPGPETPQRANASKPTPISAQSSTYSSAAIVQDLTRLSPAIMASTATEPVVAEHTTVYSKQAAHQPIRLSNSADGSLQASTSSVLSSHEGGAPGTSMASPASHTDAHDSLTPDSTPHRARHTGTDSDNNSSSADSMSILGSGSDDSEPHDWAPSSRNGAEQPTAGASRDLVLISNPFLVPIAKHSVYSKKAHSIVSASTGQDDAASGGSVERTPPRSRALGAASQATSRTAELHAAYNATQGHAVSVRGRVQRARAVRSALERDRASRAVGASARREYKLMQAAFRRSTHRTKLPTHHEHASAPSASAQRPEQDDVLGSLGGLDSSFGQPQPLPGKKRQYLRSDSGTIRAAPQAKPQGGTHVAQTLTRHSVATNGEAVVRAQRVERDFPHTAPPARAPWLQPPTSDDNVSLASQSMAYTETQSATAAGDWWGMLAGNPAKLLTSMPY